MGARVSALVVIEKLDRAKFKGINGKHG
jgi:hypothetical protein